MNIKQLALALIVLLSAACSEEGSIEGDLIEKPKIEKPKAEKPPGIEELKGVPDRVIMYDYPFNSNPETTETKEIQSEKVIFKCRLFDSLSKPDNGSGNLIPGKKKMCTPQLSDALQLQ